MKHARPDYNRIQDPAINDPSLLSEGSTPIGKDEPVFLLRAQDRTAAQVVAYWAWLNERIHDHDPKAVAFAKSHAKLMDQWQPQKIADVP